MNAPLLAALAVLVLAAPLGQTLAPTLPEEARAHPINLLRGGPCLTGDPDGETLYEEGFEAGAPGWTTVGTAGRQNLWHWTTFAGNGSETDDLFHGGPGRLYYGIENRFGGTYNTSRTRNQGEFRSPALEVPADGKTAIALNTKWHVEFDRPWLIDSMMMGYVTSSGARALLCYFGNAYAGYWNVPMGYGYYQASPSGQAVFTACEYSLESPQNPCRVTQDWADVNTNFDLAPAIATWEPRFVMLPDALRGETVRLTFYFQTGDAIVDDAMGWMIDDVRLVKVL